MSSVSTVLGNVRYALRQLRKSPGFAITAVLTLALGIGASTAIFTLFDQALLCSLPVKDPQNLVLLQFTGDRVGHVNDQGGEQEDAHVYSTYPMYRDLRDKSKVFDGLIATSTTFAGVSWHNTSDVAPTELVSGNYFDVLGIGPAAGRLFNAGDETAPGANPVVVLSFDYWKRRFNEDPGIIGQTITLNGMLFTVVGVVSPGFQSAIWGEQPHIFIPMTMQRTFSPPLNDLTDRQSYFIKIIGRLRAGVTTKQADAALAPLWHSLREMEFKSLHDQSNREYEKFVASSHLSVADAAKGFSPMREDVKTPLRILMGMVLLLVAMTAVNMASLLLVRAAGRAREFSMRYALGATKTDIISQLLTEGLLLGALGASLGVLAASQMVRLLIVRISNNSPDTPFSPQMDMSVLLFAVFVTVAVSLLFSLAPAVQFLKPNLVDSLKQNSGTGTSGSLSFRRSCVGLQIGFTLLLLVSAGLFIRTIHNLRSVNAGFPTDHLLQFYISPRSAGYEGAPVANVEERVLDAVAALPGVRGTGATNDAELSGDGSDGSVDIDGATAKPGEEISAEVPFVSKNYFATMSIPLVAGREFTVADSATASKVSVVNEMFARKHFGSAMNALGHHVSRSRRPETDTMIVGVVRDIKHLSVRDTVVPTVYRPFVQNDKPVGMTYYVRTWQTPESTGRAVRAAVRNIDSKLIVDGMQTLQQQIDQSIDTERMIALLASVFGALAALLAGIGLYGVLAYSTAQRTREIGIRMALGAQRMKVAHLILREVLVLSAIAVAVTLPVAWLLTRTMKNQLYGVSSADPIAYAGGILMIGIVVSLAALLPARRAASVDPMEALRAE